MALNDKDSTQMNETTASEELGQTKSLEPEKIELVQASMSTSSQESSHTAFENIDMLPRKYEEAPYHYDYKQNETVSLNSGALQLSYSDIVLPGKNGFDLVVERVYDSSASGKQYALPDKGKDEMYCQEIYEGQTLAMKYMYFQSKTALGTQRELNDFWEDRYTLWPPYPITPQLKTIARDNTHFLNLFGLGYGWRFNFPSIELIALTKIEQMQEHERGSMYLHLDDGRSIPVKRNYEDGKWELDDYKEHDLTVSFDSGCTIAYRNGRKDYFSGNADYGFTLSYREDKFGNRISFAYTSDKKLKQITDTFGRTIELKETVDSQNPNLKTLYWQQESSGDILFKYTVQSNQLLDARAVVRQPKDGLVERVTSYTYTQQTANTTLFWSEDESGDRGIDITYCNLTGITHPSGAKTEYSYSLFYKDLGSCMKGTVGSYVVNSRKDRISSTGSSVLHEESYSFQTKELDLTAERKKEVGTEAWGEEAIVSATVDYRANGANEKRVVSSFNRYGLLQKEQTYVFPSGSPALAQERTITYEIDGNSSKRKLPVTETVTSYDPASGNSVKVTKSWAYDSKDNVISYSESCAQDASINQSISMQYDQAYSLLLEKVTSNTNDSIKEQYDLTSDKRLPTVKRVYENGVLKERTEYEYDSYRLKRQKRYYGQSLADTTDCHVTEYNYGDRSPEPTEVRVLGVCDAQGNLVAPTNAQEAPGTILQTSTYDWFGRVTQKTDGNGNATRIEYDGLGRVTRETYPADAGQQGPSKTNTYDDANNVLLTEDEEGNRIQYLYTQMGKIAKELLVSSDGTKVLRSAFTYDSMERVAMETAYLENGSVKSITAYTYDVYGHMASRTITDTGGKELAKETSVFTPVVQSKFSRVVKTVAGEANAPAVVTETLTDQAGRVRQETVKGSGSLADAVISYTYDKLGNKLSQTDARGNVTKWEYDYAGRVVKETNAAGKASLTVYDALGNKTETTNPAGNTAHFSYDALGRLLQQESPFDGDAKAIVLYDYDAAGNVLRQRTLCSAPGELEQWRKTEYLYDSRNRLTDTLLFEEDGSENRTHYEYDNMGNKLAVYTGILGDSPDGAQKTSYTYDRFGNVLTMIDPRSNALSPDDALYRVERYNYDKTGRLVSKTDRNGSTTVYTYDALDRVVQESVTVENPSSSLTSKKYYTYTKTGQKWIESDGLIKTDGTEMFLFQPTNHELSSAPVQSSDASQVPAPLQITNQYDVMGRLVKQTESDGTVKEFAYDANGNRTGFTLTRNGTQEISLTYGYDSLNRLSEVRKAGTAIAKYGYDSNGNRSSLDYPENGIATTYSYNVANLVVSLENKKGGSVLSSFRYTYYLDGNQKDKTDQDGTVTGYLYDSMGRLRQESEAGGETIVYTYDRFSNRAKMTVSGTESFETSYTYHPNNWLLTEEKRQGDTVETTRYRYDANGNQVYREWEKVSPEDTETGTMKFVSDAFQEDVATLETREYNGFNELVAVCRDGVRIAYRYRSNGLRYGKTIRERDGKTASIVHLWDGQNIVVEIGATGTVTARYLRGINLIAREQDGANQYYLFNAHGDVVQRVDAWGNVLKNYRYDAFGNEQSPEKLDSNPFRYCGEYFDKETDEIYLRARYYNPAIGRFGAEDSARSGLNWYTYCGNNPIVFHDPTGCYSIVQTENGYNLVQEHDWAVLGRASLQFIPLLGGIAWSSPNGTVGGTSKELKPALNSNIWGWGSYALDVNGIFELAYNTSAGALSAVSPYVSMFNAADVLFQRGPVVERDKVLFQLIKFYNLPTTEFKTLESAENQMKVLNSIYERDPQYFNGPNGTHDSQFMADYRLYKMSSKRRESILMDQAGLNLYEIHDRKKYPAPEKWKKYYNLSNGYQQRINKLYSYLDN